MTTFDEPRGIVRAEVKRDKTAIVKFSLKLVEAGGGTE